MPEYDIPEDEAITFDGIGDTRDGRLADEILDVQFDEDPDLFEMEMEECHE